MLATVISGCGYSLFAVGVAVAPGLAVLALTLAVIAAGSAALLFTLPRAAG
ncbi:hypothetical protein [Dactylosporangium sp. CA-092794]|uniref:hypothetical protein n=1 Tax=Dactylosporangium sp. CA-092794 TaxID=3239929 RepID=UPI003D90D692